MSIFDIFKKKPNQVMYGDKCGKQLAQPMMNEKTGERELHIKGERYPLRGYPRGHVLHGPLAPLKRHMKNLVIEHLVKCLPNKIPDENLTEPVREIARVFDLVIKAEDEPSMKQLMGQFKDAICMVLEEDDAYRFRCQAALSKLSINKIKLSESDKYYFRAKSWRVDDFLKDKL